MMKKIILASALVFGTTAVTAPVLFANSEQAHATKQGITDVKKMKKTLTVKGVTLNKTTYKNVVKKWGKPTSTTTKAYVHGGYEYVATFKNGYKVGFNVNSKKEKPQSDSTVDSIEFKLANKVTYGELKKVSKELYAELYAEYSSKTKKHAVSVYIGNGFVVQMDFKSAKATQKKIKNTTVLEVVKLSCFPEY